MRSFRMVTVRGQLLDNGRVNWHLVLLLPSMAAHHQGPSAQLWQQEGSVGTSQTSQVGMSELSSAFFKDAIGNIFK